MTQNDTPQRHAGFDHIHPSRDLLMLLDVMKALRTPVHGCPWDLEQTFETIAPYTIEEAYEVVDAIERGDFDDLVDELGDLLLQVVYHAQMASEAGRFEFGDVVYAVTKKMIRRHPHVFGNVSGLSSGAVSKRWDEIKAEERAEKAARKGLSQTDTTQEESVLSGIPVNLPALTYALKLQKKAAKVGFDWNDPRAVVQKVAEEASEIVEALDEQTSASVKSARVQDEIGDLLFTIANLARHLDVDPETALRRTSAKFEKRFGHIETTLKARETNFSDTSLDEMEALWVEAKALD